MPKRTFPQLYLKQSLQYIPILFALTIIFLCLSFYFSLVAFSQFSLQASDIYQVLFNYDANNLNQQIIVSLRLPRSLVAILAGVAMACAGLLMQGITRNSLASPSVFGVSAGAAFAFAFSTTGLLPWLSAIPVLFITMFGALIAGVAVFFLGGLHRPQTNPIRIVLAGVAINYLCISMTRAAIIYADDNAYGVLHWLIGSVSNTQLSDVYSMLPGIVIGLTIAVFFSHKLNLLHIGDSVMNSLGSSATSVRLWLSIAIILLIASAVSVVGPIGFIGLIIPHLCRAMIGQDYRLLIPLCVLCGASLMLCADSLARIIRFPDDSPIGIVTTSIGAVFFLMLALKQVRRAP